MFLAAAAALAVIPGGGTANATPTLAETERTLSDLGTKLDAINEQYNKANALLKISRAKQAALEVQLKPYQAKADAYQKKVAEIGAAAYRGGRTSMIASMLRGQSPQDVIDQAGVLDQITRDQQGTIAALEQAKKPVEAMQVKLKAEIELQAKQEKVLRERKAVLDRDVTKWKALAAQLRPRASRGTDRTQSAATPVYDGPASGRGATVVRYAYAHLGAPYVFGAAGPYQFDCSGLALAAWAQVGVSMPHSSHLQYDNFPHVSRSALQPGDLVFFYGGRSHVGIYIGGNRVIHAPQPGESVKISSMDVFPFNGAVRPG